MKVKLITLSMHLLIWLLLLVIPYVTTDQIFDTLAPGSSNRYLITSLISSSLSISTFYLNYFVLIPKYLLKKKYWLYCLFIFISIVVVIRLSSVILLFSDFDFDKMEQSAPPIEKFIPVILVNSILLWLLAIAFSILLAAYNRLKQTESEKLSAQIASLKSQINPHFLFNTLNNIYAYTFDIAPKASDMVDRLSEMMRYTMKHTQQDYVMLDDEINYVSNYIELQKIRLDKRIKLEYEILGNGTHLKIAPMLLIPFVENAFKHGVNSEQKSHIKITMQLDHAEFQLKVINNKVEIQNDLYERSGLGIKNTKDRLDLIYPSRHLLVINDSPKEFSVSLHINLQ